MNKTQIPEKASSEITQSFGNTNHSNELVVYSRLSGYKEVVGLCRYQVEYLVKPGGNHSHLYLPINITFKESIRPCFHRVKTLYDQTGF